MCTCAYMYVHIYMAQSQQVTDLTKKEEKWEKAQCVDLRRKKTSKKMKVRCDEEGSSSKRPELAAFVLALRDTPVSNQWVVKLTKPMLNLCDEQALLKILKKWVGEVGKATLVGAPDADNLLESVEEFWKWITTFLIKVRAHRGELANEEADIQADKAIFAEMFHSMAWQDTLINLHRHSARASPERRQDLKSTWNSGVRKATRRGSAASGRKRSAQAPGSWERSLQKKTANCMSNFDETAAVFRCTCNGTCAPEHTLCHICYHSFCACCHRET